MRGLSIVLVLLTGCIEYDAISTNPAAGVVNERPLEAKTQSDKLVQVLPVNVDVLWVIDNSSSMGQEQDQLRANFDVFMNYFAGSGLDYHIGVTSTDMNAGGAGNGGRLNEISGYRWIDESAENPVATFGNLADLGTGGNTTERGLDATYSALETLSFPGQFNEGFSRDDAAVHVIVVSDEEDDSNGSVSEFANWMLGLRPDPETVTFSSIVTPNNTSQCSESYESGTRYIEATGLVGGILQSICSDDWSAMLEDLGIQAAGLTREYFLSQLPVPGSITVQVVEDGVDLDFEAEIDWTYSATRNSITFVEFTPSALSEVFIRYEVLGASEG